ncbi:MAG: malic enzyme-like NAD(P)-binding protein, partial [Terracidiphilus sp.]
EGLSAAEARGRIYGFNRYGLLVEGCQGVRPGQERMLRTRDEVAGWHLSDPAAVGISLLDAVRNAKITILLGVSAQAGAFTEEIVRAVGANSERPVIFPLSNPTSKSEAIPADILRWTGGGALVGTGSPFLPVEYDGRQVRISQVNNSYIFPGLALGILVSRARIVTDSMIMASAKALASLSPTREDPGAPLLPPIADARKVSLVVAEAVGRQAIHEGVAQISHAHTLKELLEGYVWEPEYLPYERHDLSWIKNESGSSRSHS